MTSQNILIKFHGMENKRHPVDLEEYLEALLRHAPSNSTCYLHIFKEPKGYLCKLTVHSNVKTFSAQTKDENASSSVKNVLRNVKNQIAGWKKNRSSLELTGVTSITGLSLRGMDTEPANEEDFDLFHKKAA